MFVKIETRGPDEYGLWTAEANFDGGKSVGMKETEHGAIEDAKEMVAMYFQIPVDEVIQDGGVIRREKGDED